MTRPTIPLEKRPKALTIRAGAAEAVVPTNLTAEDFEIFDLYLEQCDALAETDWVRNSQGVGFTLTAKDGKPIIETRAPSEEAISAVLHRMRPFLLENEPASFLTAASIAGRTVADPRIRGWLKVLRREFSGRDFRETVQIYFRGASIAAPDKPITEQVNTQASFRDWLNGFEYHRDLEKRRRISGVTQSAPALARTVYLEMLAGAMQAVFELAKLVSALAGYSTSIRWEGGELPAETETRKEAKKDRSEAD